jgi:hypothetical protein
MFTGFLSITRVFHFRTTRTFARDAGFRLRATIAGAACMFARVRIVRCALRWGEVIPARAILRRYGWRHESLVTRFGALLEMLARLVESAPRISITLGKCAGAHFAVTRSARSGVEALTRRHRKRNETIAVCRKAFGVLRSGMSAHRILTCGILRRHEAARACAIARRHGRHRRMRGTVVIAGDAFAAPCIEMPA